MKGDFESNHWISNKTCCKFQFAWSAFIFKSSALRSRCSCVCRCLCKLVWVWPFLHVFFLKTNFIIYLSSVWLLFIRCSHINIKMLIFQFSHSKKISFELKWKTKNVKNITKMFINDWLNLEVFFFSNTILFSVFLSYYHFILM